jgi:C-methyltransferase
VIVVETPADRTPEPRVTTALDLLLLLNVAGRKHTTPHVAELFAEYGRLRYVGVRDTGTFLEGTVPDDRGRR